MERAFRVAFKRVLDMSLTKHGNKKSTYKSAWQPAPAINSLKHVIGHTRSGICRRPIISDGLWREVVRICSDARLMGNCSTTFGVGYKVNFDKQFDKKWTPSILSVTYGMIQKRTMEKTEI